MVVFTYRVAGKVYVNEDVRWGFVAARFFAAPTPALPHGGGSRTAMLWAAVVVSDGRRCAKAHPMVFFTYS